MKINFINIDDFFLKRKIKKAYKKTLQMLDINQKIVDVNVGYISDEAIKKLNKEHRDVDKVTDVLSFPLLELEIPLFLTEEIIAKEAHPVTKSIELGDVVICESVAEKQAEKLGHSKKREVCFLALHGFLHLLGFDHQTKEEEENMNNLCQKVLSDIGVNR